MIYSLDGVTKQYRTREGVVDALAGVTLEVREGEHVALIGRSGGGKSTLFRLLNATQRPTGGLLEFGGREIGRMSGRELRGLRRRVGTVYQQHHLVPSLSVLDNALCGRLGRWSLLHTLGSVLRPSRQEVEEAAAVLEAVGLADKLRARADELSGGEQQRLAIARALMQEPDVLLADEPVASLDPALADSITNLLVRIAADSKRTLVVSLHAVELARSYFPRVVALRRGRVAFDVSASRLDHEMLDEVFVDTTPEAKERPRPDAHTWGKLHCAR
ncbi:MAG: ATP-binding cassette domain-containing protein [Acidobacteria bacterium]|nr:ATP-binding cassette domain-containing protein [Acidobacteriota bacterium]